MFITLREQRFTDPEFSFSHSVSNNYYIIMRRINLRGKISIPKVIMRCVDPLLRERKGFSFLSDIEGNVIP